jgi:hypothetical protein
MQRGAERRGCEHDRSEHRSRAAADVVTSLRTKSGTTPPRMKISSDSWTVIDEDAGVLSRSYSFGPATANTVVVRLGEGRLLVVSPGRKLPASAFEELAEHGKVVAMLAPNGFHYLGMSEWVERFPEARLFATQAAARRINKRQPSRRFEPIDAIDEHLPDHVHVNAPPAMKDPDVFVRVDTDAGAVWFSNDVLGNMAALPDHWLFRFLFKVTRSGPGFSVNRLALKFLGPKPAFREFIVRQMKEHPPRILVPGHGAALTGDDLGKRTVEVLEAGL